MAATLMDGKALAARIRAEVAEEVAELGHVGLATVLVGDDPASEIYIRLKHKAATRGGIDGARPTACRRTRPRRSCSAIVAELNADDAVDGILVQLPLPEHIDEARVIRVASTRPRTSTASTRSTPACSTSAAPGLVPATPLGIMALLAEYDVPLEGARAVVVGRSDDRRQAGRAPAPARRTRP